MIFEMTNLRKDRSPAGNTDGRVNKLVTLFAFAPTPQANL